MSLDYENDVKIDEEALDVEWIEQPELAHKYAKEVARLQNEVAVLDEKKKIKRSELIDQANRDPKNTIGKDKPNASDIEAFYRRDEEYQEIVEELLNKQKELNFAEAAKNEICFTRKQALENLVKLHGMSYFAGPQVPRDITQEKQNWEEKKEEKQKSANRRASGNKRGMKRGK